MEIVPSSGCADGTYCAEVTYHYSRTGTTSTYILLVDVEDNRLVKIHWPNGGWLDETHYKGPTIEDGAASFTSDIGADYTLRIQGEEGSYSLDSDTTNEEEIAQEREEEEEQPDQTSTEDEQE
jgi:predicted dehydrogenase